MGSLLKERVNHEAAHRLADAIAAVDATFDAEAFVAEASEPLQSLELKARVDHIAATLDRYLTGPFDHVAQVLCAAATGAALDTWAAWGGEFLPRGWVWGGPPPRLPWARRLAAPNWDPLAALPLLDRLHDDPEM